MHAVDADTSTDTTCGLIHSCIEDTLRRVAVAVTHWGRRMGGRRGEKRGKGCEGDKEEGEEEIGKGEGEKRWEDKDVNTLLLHL